RRPAYPGRMRPRPSSPVIPADPEVADTTDEVSAWRLATGNAEKPSDLFGGARGLVDSGLPPVAFVAVNAARGLTAATWAAVAVGVALLAVRLARKEPLRHTVSGFLGVLIAALIARGTGRAENFFLPGIVINAVYGGGFLVSAMVRKPLVGVLLRQFSDKPPDWHDDPRVRRAYAEATVGWAAVFIARVIVQSLLVAAGRPGWLAVTKIAMGWPLFLGALALTLPWVSRRTAEVPIAGGAEAG
ncbi:MAG: DUF3159 domain-containing protein, partial [Thermoleophilaceae bacterium]